MSTVQNLVRLTCNSGGQACGGWESAEGERAQSQLQVERDGSLAPGFFELPPLQQRVPFRPRGTVRGYRDGGPLAAVTSITQRAECGDKPVDAKKRMFKLTGE